MKFGPAMTTSWIRKLYVPQPMAVSTSMRYIISETPTSSVERSTLIVWGTTEVPPMAVAVQPVMAGLMSTPIVP